MKLVDIAHVELIAELVDIELVELIDTGAGRRICVRCHAGDKNPRTAQKCLTKSAPLTKHI